MEQLEEKMILSHPKCYLFSRIMVWFLIGALVSVVYGLICKDNMEQITNYICTIGSCSGLIGGYIVGMVKMLVLEPEQ